MQLTLRVYLLPYLFTRWSDLCYCWAASSPEALAAHTAWVKGQKEVVVLMLMTMEPYLQWNLETLDAYDMLQDLKTM
ncbi:hypothetical protein Tco_0872965, partial [Tanacetum coccineum]